MFIPRPVWLAGLLLAATFLIAPTLAVADSGTTATPLTVSVSPAEAREGQAVNFVVTLSGQFPQPVWQPVRVEYATSSGTAASGTDFLATSGTLVFWHGGERTHEHSQVVRVPTTHDTVQEGDETFTLTLSSSTHPTLGSATATGRITNNSDAVAAQTPRVDAIGNNVAEGDEIAFEVFLSATSDRPVTVQYATESGADRVRSNAQSGKDFTAASGTLSFAPGETRKTVRVSTTSDSAYEWNELFYLRLSNPTNARLNSSGGYLRRTGKIVDDDPPPTVSISDGSATEGGKVEFTISLSAPTGRTVYVDFNPEVGPGDTATFSDFERPEATQLAFGGGTEQRPPSYTLRVVTADDDIDEEDETFTMRLSNPRNATLGDATGTGTIIDDDDGTAPAPSPSDLPTVGFWQELDSNVDAGGLMIFRVSLSKRSDRQVSVQYTTSSGTAQSGADFTPRAGALVFQPGDRLKYLHVPTTRRDRSDEGNKTFTVTLSNPIRATLGDATATGTITDADTDVDGSPYVAVKASTDAVEGKPVTFTVRLSAPTEQTVTVQYQARGIRCLSGNNCGTATSGVDYVATSGTLTFAAHQTEKTVNVSTTDDSGYEGTEELYLELSNPTNAVFRTLRSSNSRFDRHVTARILDNDDPPVASFASQASSAQEESGTHNVTINLSAAPTYPIDVYVSNVSSGVGSGTATYGADYRLGSGSVSVPSGATTATIPVTIVDDDVDDSGETIVLKLTTNSAGYTVGESSTHTVTIQEQVTPDTPEVSISAGAGVTEGGSATFTLTASPAPAAALTVDVTVTESGGYATAGTRQVTVPTGGTATFTVATVDDGADEPDGSVTATVTAGSGYTVSSSQGAATVAVTDNDDPAPPPLTASFERMPSQHDGKAAFSFLVRFSTALGADGVAPTVASFGASKAKVKRVQRVEPGLWRVRVKPASWRDVTVTLAGGRGCGETGAVCASGGQVLSNAASATVGGPAQIQLKGGTAREGRDATLDFAVTLNRAASAAVSVDYTTADGTAKAGADYTAASGTLTFAPGETAKSVSVAILDDAIDEGKETFLLKLSNPQGAFLRNMHRKAKGVIRNEDPLQAMWLSRFGRTVASDAVAALTARFETPRAAGSHLTMLGERVNLSQAGDGSQAGAKVLAGVLTGLAQAFGAPNAAQDDPGTGFEAGDPFARPGTSGMWNEPATTAGGRRVTERELLMGTSFRAVLPAGAGSQFTSWGQGASVSQFSAGAQGLGLTGEAATGSMGFDYERGRLLTGFAMMHSVGEGTARDGEWRYAMGSTVTTMLPYARLKLTERVSAWGMAGTGTGRMTLDLDGGVAQRYRTDLTMTLAATGVRGDLVTPAEAGGFALALKADAFWVRTESDRVSAPGVGNLAAAQGEASRMRAMLDGSRTFALAGGATLSPSVELGVRQDGGDAETGTGMEFGAGLGYADPTRGLDMALRVHGLAMHAEQGYEEWGVSGQVRLVPGGAGRGLSASLTPSYGVDPGGSQRLWALPESSRLTANGETDPSSRLDAEMGYGMVLFGDRFTGTPHVGFGLSDTAREYRLGWRLTSAVRGDPGFEVNLDATRREAANADEPAEHGVMLRSSIRW